MQIDGVIKKLFFIPRDYNSSGNISVYELVRDSGYFQVNNDISEESIRKYLENYPECIDEWISYSEDKRTKSGYYFLKKEESFIVGYFDDDKAKQMEIKFKNGIEACAFYIKREIESIRDSLN